MVVEISHNSTAFYTLIHLIFSLLPHPDEPLLDAGEETQRRGVESIILRTTALPAKIFSPVENGTVPIASRQINHPRPATTAEFTIAVITTFRTISHFHFTFLSAV